MYTVIIYKKDKRTKAGERRVHYADYDTTDLSTLEHTVRHTWRASQGFRYEIHATMVKRTNLMVVQSTRKGLTLLVTVAHPAKLIGRCKGRSGPGHLPYGAHFHFVNLQNRRPASTSIPLCSTCIV